MKATRYTGHVSGSELPLMPIKCRINDRERLVDRIQPVQAVANRPVAQTPEPVRSYFLPKRHHGETTYESGTHAFVRSAADVPERRKEPKAILPEGILAPRFSATSTSQLDHMSVCRGTPTDFFSRARQLERVDDDARRDVYIPPTRAGASHMQRTVDIMRNREHRDELQPPSSQYERQPRTRPAIPGTSAAENVRFTHISPPTTHQLDFRPPAEGLNQVQLHLSQGSVASRALTHAATSRDLFVGTPKDIDAIVPGFMGHVPAAQATKQRLHGPDDMLRQYSKCSLNVAVAARGDTATAPESQQRSPSPGSLRRGALTVAAFYEEQAASSAEERRMNVVEHGRHNAVRQFFSHGAGDADTTLADQFCVKFRPGGGAMKVGPSSSWSWVSDKDLKRTTIV